jgi:hypothetical protein
MFERIAWRNYFDDFHTFADFCRRFEVLYELAEFHMYALRQHRCAHTYTHIQPGAEGRGGSGDGRDLQVKALLDPGAELNIISLLCCNHCIINRYQVNIAIYQGKRKQCTVSEIAARRVAETAAAQRRREQRRAAAHGNDDACDDDDDEGGLQGVRQQIQICIICADSHCASFSCCCHILFSGRSRARRLRQCIPGDRQPLSDRNARSISGSLEV